MATQTTILEKFRHDDYLVTLVRYTFDGEINDTIDVSVYHFRPRSESEVLQNINNRGESEKSKMIAQNLIDQILPNVNL